jgi:hypothetical protein
MQLSCSRNLPCQRCVRSGRPGLCSFDTETSLAQQEAQHNSDENQDLRAEISQLRELLTRTGRQQNDGRGETLPGGLTNIEYGQEVLPNGTLTKVQTPAHIISTLSYRSKEQVSTCLLQRTYSFEILSRGERI